MSKKVPPSKEKFVVAIRRARCRRGALHRPLRCQRSAGCPLSRGRGAIGAFRRRGNAFLGNVAGGSRARRRSRPGDLALGSHLLGGRPRRGLSGVADRLGRRAADATQHPNGPKIVLCFWPTPFWAITRPSCTIAAVCRLVRWSPCARPKKAAKACSSAGKSGWRPSCRWDCRSGAPRRKTARSALSCNYSRRFTGSTVRPALA